MPSQLLTSSDVAETMDFLSQLYSLSDNPKKKINVLTLDEPLKDTPKPESLNPVQLWGTLARLWPTICEHNNNGRAVHYLVGEAAPGSRSRKNVDIVMQYSLFIDIDNNPLPTSFPIPPSAIVSRSDGKGHHVYWFINPITDMSAWTMAQKRLIAYYSAWGADDQIFNPGRNLRLPGTFNFKYPKPLRYNIVKITSDSTRYKLVDIIAAHTDPVNVDKVIKRSVKKIFGPGRVQDGEGRHSKILSFAYLLKDLNVSDRDALKKLVEVNDKKLVDKKTLTELKTYLDSSNKYRKDDPGSAVISRSEKELEKLESIKPLLSTFYYIIDIDRFILLDRIQVLYKREQFNHFFMKYQIGNAYKLAAKHNALNEAYSVCYEPGQPQLFTIKGYLCINQYIAPDISQVRKTPTWFIDHVKYLFPDPLEHNHIFDFLAFMVQHPTRRIRHAMVLCGKQGTGKSAICEVLKKVLGSENVSEPQNRQLTEKYTTWIARTQLVFIHELKQPDKLDFIEMMKSHISEDEIYVREMYMNPYKIRNYANIIAATNHINSLQLDSDDRRWFIAESKAEQRDHTYYAKLFQENIVNDCGEVMWWLNTRDVSMFDPGRRPPMTEAKQYMIELSRPEFVVKVEQYIDAAEGEFMSDVVELSDLIIPLKLEFGKYATQNRLQLALKQLGCIKLEKMIKIEGRPRRYWVIRNIDLWEARMQDGTLNAHVREVVSGRDNPDTAVFDLN